MIYKIWHDEAWDEYIEWQRRDKKTLNKITQLQKDIDRNGLKCTGKPEPLSGNMPGILLHRIAAETKHIVYLFLGNEKAVGTFSMLSAFSVLSTAFSSCQSEENRSICLYSSG